MASAMASLLDLRRLRYFKAIAEHGSFAAAARALNVAQPALSHHMAELERLLGVVLLDRSSRGAGTTEAGAMLLDRARTILAEVVRAEHCLVDFLPDGRRRSVRTIRIAIIASLAASLTPLLFEAVSRELPGVALHITEAPSHLSVSMLEQGDLDLAVTLATTHGFNSAPLTREQLMLVSAVGPEGPCTRPVTFHELARKRLILQSRSRPVRKLLDDHARALGLSLDIVLEVDGGKPSIRAVIEGVGSTVLAPFNVAEEVSAGQVEARPITDPPIGREIVLQRVDGFDPVMAATMRRILIGLLDKLLARHA
jgi:LysR family nitrogen assimilation transcriptional regulator